MLQEVNPRICPPVSTNFISSIICVTYLKRSLSILTPRLHRAILFSPNSHGVGYDDRRRRDFSWRESLTNIFHKSYRTGLSVVAGYWKQAVVVRNSPLKYTVLETFRPLVGGNWMLADLIYKSPNNLPSAGEDLWLSITLSLAVPLYMTH